MVTVKFSDDFNWSPPERARTVIAYQAGKTYEGVRRLCAEVAVAAGKGEIVKAFDGSALTGIAFDAPVVDIGAATDEDHSA